MKRVKGSNFNRESKSILLCTHCRLGFEEKVKILLLGARFTIEMLFLNYHLKYSTTGSEKLAGLKS